MVLFYIILISMIFFYGTLISIFIYKYTQRKLNTNLVKNFTEYISVLQYHMDKAYDIIYKDGILIYSIEATKPDDKEINSLNRRFLGLMLHMLGKNLLKELILIYGNEETLFFNMSEYFTSRIDTDEIRKSTQNDLLNDSIGDNDENP